MAGLAHRYDGTDDERRLVARLEAFASRFAPVRVLLFGSRARGTYTSESDFDLIVVSPRFEGVPFLRRPVEWLVALSDIAAVEVLCYTPDELDRKARGMGIVAEALRTGRWIVEV